MDNDFKGYAESLGTVIILHHSKHSENTGRTRLAHAFFEKEMFVYFGQVSSGQTGWGVSFNDWLALNGWQLIDFVTYMRVESALE